MVARGMGTIGLLPEVFERRLARLRARRERDRERREHAAKKKAGEKIREIGGRTR